MTWEWEKLRENQRRSEQGLFDNRFMDDTPSPQVRRQRAIRNIIVLSIVLVLGIAVVGFLSTVFYVKKEETKIAFSKLSDVVKDHKERKKSVNNMPPYETCINGIKVVIVNGTTYYSGTVDTWGDVKTIKCE